MIFFFTNTHTVHFNTVASQQDLNVAGRYIMLHRPDTHCLLTVERIYIYVRQRLAPNLDEGPRCFSPIARLLWEGRKQIRCSTRRNYSNKKPICERSFLKGKQSLQFEVRRSELQLFFNLLT